MCLGLAIYRLSRAPYPTLPPAISDTLELMTLVQDMAEIYTF